MNITNILSSFILAMDEKEYNRTGRGDDNFVTGYERKKNMKRNYTSTNSFSDRYPATSSQFMRRR